MRTKGQVTVFIILGLVLLIVIGVFFAFRGTIVEGKLDEARFVAEDVPFEFVPIKEFTEICLKTVAEEGLQQLGQHGGFIEPELWHGFAFSELDQTDADGLTFSGGGLKVPYWLHNDEPDNSNVVRFASARPTLRDMEKDLVRWVEQEVPACLNGYVDFVDQGFSVTEGKLDAATTIVSGNVRFALDHPLEVEKGNSAVDMRRFFTEIPVDLMQMHSVASVVTEAQQNYSFMEKNMLGLMTLFSSPEPGKLMPMTDTTFDVASTSFWTQTELKEDVTTILSNYVSLFRYDGSRNFFRYTYPTSEYSGSVQRVYDDSVLPLTGAEGLDVRFNYLDAWEPYFDMNCEGELCRPQSMTVDLFGHPFGVQRYKAVYDLSYPVFVSLYDPEALDNQGYTFNFALEGNIRNNRPAFDGVLPAVVSSFENTLLCDDEQRNSGDVSVVVRDAFTGEPVPDALVSFVLDDASCAVGSTNEAGVFVGKFPIAIGGFVHALAVDYVGSARPLDTALGQDEDVAVELWGYHEGNLAVQKKELINCKRMRVGFVEQDRCYTVVSADAGAGAANPLDAAFRFSSALPGYAGSSGIQGSGRALRTGWLFSPLVQDLGVNERAVMSFTRVSEFDDPFTYAAAVRGTGKQQMRLPPGEYEVTIDLLSGEKLIIPADERCFDTDDDDEECVTIKKIEFDQFSSGGADYVSNGTIVISPGSWYGSDTVTFFALSPAFKRIPQNKRVIEDLSIMENIKAWSATRFRKQLEPRYE